MKVIPVQQPVSTPTAAPTEWIRIFACRLAQKRPELSAAETIRAAIDAFAHSAHLQPEDAVTIQ